MSEHEIRGILIAGVTALLLLAGCSEPAGPVGVERAGVVQWYSSGAFAGDPTATEGEAWPGPDDAVIEAPETVRAGEAFEAVVWTVGASGCWEAARTDVENDPSLAEIRPVDRDRMTEGLFCTAVLKGLRHPVELVFTEPGEATIRVVGRLVVGDDFSQGEEFVVEKTVTVTS